MHDFLIVLRKAYRSWKTDKASHMGAAMAYYTILAIAPILLIVIALAGLIFGEAAARGEVLQQIQQSVGLETAQLIQSVLVNAQRNGAGTWATLIGLVLVFVSATGLVAELKYTLNKMWDIKHETNGFKNHLIGRAIAFALILAVGALLIVFLGLGAFISALGSSLSGTLPGVAVFIYLLNTLLFIGATTVLFASLYSYLPIKKIHWKDAVVGGLVAAVLFTLGKALMAWYFSQANIGLSYGAAGSLVVFLVWIYYSSQIFYFGAEVTKALEK